MIKTINVRNLYYALLTSTNAAGVAPTYGTPVLLAGLINIKVNHKGGPEVMASDGVVSDKVDFLGSIEVEINITDISQVALAALLGNTRTGGGTDVAADDQAPWVAIAFQSQKSNKKWRYAKLWCGSFVIPDDEHKTMGPDKVELGTGTIKGVFYPRAYDLKLKRVLDEDDVDFNAAEASAWFTSFGSVDSTPPTISSVTPANAATGVAIGSTVAWVFSEAIQPGCMTSDHFALVKDTDGSNVAGTFVLSNGGKTVTFTPSGNLTAAAAYRAIVTPGVKDLAGNALAAPSVTKFTCA